MAVLKFRVYVEEDSGVYRDIVIQTAQLFQDLHACILQSYGFDNKHQATFYRSNEHWQRGRQISLEKYDRPYRVEPLLMADTVIGTEIKDTNQHFIYEYDFDKNWIFLLELIGINKDADPRKEYPYISRTEGVGPQQYGNKSLLPDQFIDIEEKYDLDKNADGFESEGGDDADQDDSDNQDESDDQQFTDDL
ncbi:hypothetical protein GCM10027566_07560 [Arachidicoccus ginsenosidivorans]|jgi:hypothetical protein|uniref:Plasmid pRiA4b ORF-3 family protein n=1 Tax=Arachidicoccus ginsenosidivorans TaxID=496057 RepID=A0A5B8VTE2_9BACT|nr:plasmid pRiA4b ORF-3 family protein [Arachidicoccus ginsenosidivorans]QEC73418.1 plasmid pRiA4b ORF-3 family protein [Arachidicoccus ginsenosidivorans]